MSSSALTPRVHPAVDWLKALAIVAVVTAHSGAFVLSPETMGLDRYVRATLVAFHVPLFLMVSGYLHATAVPVGLWTIWRRWRSILGAYLVASLAMLTFHVEWPWAVASWPFLLLTGGALGIYYYVPVWLACVATGWAWSRLPARALGVALLIVTAQTLARQMWPEVPTDFVWAIRDPFLQPWFFCYLFGWCARRLEWDAWVDANRWSAVLALLCCFRWVCMPEGAPHLTRTVYAVGVAWLVLVFCRRPAPDRVRWLAQETLLVYLWHVPVALFLWASVRDWPDIVRLPVVVAGTLSIVMSAIATWRIAAGVVRPAQRPSGADRAGVDTRRAA